MQQIWKDLLFLHYRIQFDLLRKLVPSRLELDQYNNECWISITPFKMRKVRLRVFLPIPTTYNFLELNLRTYVKHNGRPGIYFFSLDASSTIAAMVARIASLPYFRASMSIEDKNNHFNFESYRKGSAKTPADFKVDYNPHSEPFLAPEGTLNHWLVERYCLYQTTKTNKIVTIDIHHLPWKLQNANAEISTNSLIEAMGIQISPQQPIAQFAKYQKVLVWPLRFVT